MKEFKEIIDNTKVNVSRVSSDTSAGPVWGLPILILPAYTMVEFCELER